MNGVEIEFASFAYDCFVAKAQDGENRFYIMHISE